MKKFKTIYISLVVAVALSASSCIGDLDQYPVIEDTSKSVYTSVENYKMVLAKLYASYVISGQEKGGGNGDISGSNTGQDYMRVYVNMQEVPTDELAYTWGEGDKLYDLTYMNWDSNDNWASDMYYHIYYTVALCNEFLRNATEVAISGFSDGDKAQIRVFRAEARFLRALAYCHAIDLFGDVPFVDENDPVGDYLPPQYTRSQLFGFVESELKDIEDILPAPAATEYGRASQAAAWALLARLYLNGEVYTGNVYYTECITYCNKVFLGGFSLESDYAKLFNADNHLRTNEIIFAFNVDATHTMSWGATTYIICGSVSSSNSQQVPADYGVSSGWTSFRAKNGLTSKFTDLTGATDQRAMFFTDGQSAAVTNIDDEFTGYLFTKWTNLTDAGQAASNTAADGVSTDLPIFRLADVNLMFAEAVVRGGTGATRTEALAKVNDVRTRAYHGTPAGNIADGEMTLDFLLNERARELYLESVRRTDLIRFGKFTGSDYVWEFKGGTAAGSGVDAKYRLYPIPATELTANPNIKSTPGF